MGDFVIERLRAWGVQRVFGYPGDGINGTMAGFEHASSRKVYRRTRRLPRHLGPGRHPSVERPVRRGAGPPAGGRHVGQSATTALGGDYQQEVDLQNLFKDVAHNYVTTVTTPSAARHAIDRAFRIAISEKCVFCVIVPKDLQDMIGETIKTAVAGIFKKENLDG